MPEISEQQRILSEKLKRFKKALAVDPSYKPTIELTENLPHTVYGKTSQVESPNIQINKSKYEKYPKMFNSVIAHEVGHHEYEPSIFSPKHSSDPTDLMYTSPGYDPNKYDTSKETLAAKLKRRALQNLKRQEKEGEESLYSEYLMSNPIRPYPKNPPIPVEQMYENIEKNVPKHKKYAWDLEGT